MQRIRGSGTDLIINLTCGPGGRFIPSDDDPAKPAPGTLFKAPEIRTEHIVELKPEICTLDLNTMWFGGGAVINTPRSLRIMAGRMYAAGVKPELEVFDTGDLVMAQDLVADGTLKAAGSVPDRHRHQVRYALDTAGNAARQVAAAPELRMGGVRSRPARFPMLAQALHPRRPLPYRHGGHRAYCQGHTHPEQCRTGREGRAHHSRAGRENCERREARSLLGLPARS